MTHGKESLCPASVKLGVKLSKCSVLLSFVCDSLPLPSGASLPSPSDTYRKAWLKDWEAWERHGGDPHQLAWEGTFSPQRQTQLTPSLRSMSGYVSEVDKDGDGVSVAQAHIENLTPLCSLWTDMLSRAEAPKVPPADWRCRRRESGRGTWVKDHRDLQSGWWVGGHGVFLAGELFFSESMCNDDDVGLKLWLNCIQQLSKCL